MLMTEDRAELMYYLGKAFPRLEWIELVILAAYGEGLCAAGAARQKRQLQKRVPMEHLEERKVAV